MEVNNRKRKSKKFPATALAFYIKVYCKQKSSSKTKYTSKLVEATKSWLSLSESEKQEVNAKYNDCQEKYKLRFIDQLKNAEPFMKAKDSRLNNSRVETPNSTVLLPHQEHENNVEELETQEEPPEQLEQSTELDLVYDEQDTINQVQNEGSVITQGFNVGNERTSIAEPLPPPFKTGKDLFQMLNTCTYSEDEADKITWVSLPQFEKNQYSRAVCLLKKDYLTKYREYLESLSSKELFNYYHKTVA
ncbi:uncharacterized protein LOC113496342 isoform X2 [Trichoplusia ni]|uniref:Uncharacterized protein LOC113496342 isoform X2 n=1 Tax=Trichoplusia ni TaxID=7111 RepID=A0A7E5VSS4_TRINI|nr:uncharacterized protein LOC113496342 isoform X2 [Trichoplusia ni]